MPGFEEARYTITVTGQWTSPGFSVPPGAHFTTFIGMVHNNAANLWDKGAKATAGMEVLAETGGGAPVLAEIDSMVRVGNALSLLLFVAPAVNGTSTVSFNCNSNYPMISFASMLGPTPDWFTGVSRLTLYSNHQWVKDTTINLYTFDAGTEEGDVFGYNNPATIPQQNIQLLRSGLLGNGNPELPPVATIRLVRQ